MGSLREKPEARAELDAEVYDEHGIPQHVRDRWAAKEKELKRDSAGNFGKAQDPKKHPKEQ